MINLFKTDTKDKLRVLQIYTEGADLVQVSGLVDGAKVTHRKTCVGKNIGRANETTPEDQAISEMNSKAVDKQTEGYFLTKEEAMTTNVILPMLAKDYKKESHKIDWSGEVHLQPKFDGMRCLAHVKNHTVKMMSRDGKEITTLPHIASSLSQLDDIILDGELYAHGQNFQENMRLIKKNRGIETEQVKFHIYDTVSPLPFDKRDVRSVIKGIPFLEEVSTYKITSEAELKEHHVLFLKDGYEGTMVRHGKDGYKVNGRSSSLLKYKDFIDIVLKIAYVEPSPQRPEWGQFAFDWKGASGHRLGEDILGCGMKFSHAERIEILANKEHYIGLIAEVRFFEYSETGVPRFPVAIGIRLDK